ncbi:hypothetical protein N431DRAFT_490289 [Stipitochalara longipes BDJ]|nr:hypothetical protein N431DRAFT_490289 [Stipitochalara longipes BDJ]
MSKWGRHGSVYWELSIDEQDALEKALRLVRYGLYLDAEKAFGHRLLQQCRHPIIAVERSGLYHTMGLEFKVLEVLEGLEPPRDRLCSQTGSDIWELIQLLRFEADAMTYGMLRPAVDFAQSVSQKLLGKDSLEHTDIESHCMSLSKRLQWFARNYSNWLEVPNDDAPQPSAEIPNNYHSGKAKTMNLEELITALELKREDHFGSREVKADTMEESTSNNKTNTPELDESAMFEACLMKIKEAEALAKTEKFEDSQKELYSVEALITQAITTHGLGERYFRHLRLRANKTRLLCDRHSSLETKCKLYLDLSDEAFEFSSFQIYRQLLAAAMKLSQKARSQAIVNADISKAREIQHLAVTKRLELEEKYTHSSYHLASFLEVYAHHVVGISESQGAEFTGFVESFAVAFPDFGFPKLAFYLTQSAMRSYVSQGNNEAAARYREQRSFWLRECPRDMSENALLRDDVDDESAWRVWAINTSESETWIEDYQDVCATLIQRWALREFEAKKLELDELKYLLQFEVPAKDILPTILDDDDSHEPTVAPFDDIPDPMTQMCIINSVEALPSKVLAARLFGRPEPVKAGTWDPWFKEIEGWLRTPGRGPSKMQRELLLRQISRFRVAGIVKFHSPRIGQLSGEETFEWMRAQQNDSRECLRIQKSIDPQLVGEHDMDRALWDFASSTIIFANEFATNRSRAPSDDDLVEAIQIFTDILTKQKAEKRLQPAYRTVSSIARAHWTRYSIYRIADPWACLPFWSEADRLYQEMRSDHRGLSNPSAFTAKEQLASSTQQQVFRKHAILAAIHSIQELGKMPSDKPDNWSPEKWMEIMDYFVEFVQKSKAQSITDLLGRRIKPPKSVIGTILKQPPAREIWEERENLLAQFQQTSLISKRLELGPKIESNTNTLRENYPILAPFLDMEMGEAISAPQLQKFGQELGSSVVLVEWIEILNGKHDLLLLIYREGTITSATPIHGIKLVDVDHWVAEYLDEPEENIADDPPLTQRNARQCLNELKPLVASLEDLTAPGETLVFCPTLSLHRVPLHALSVGKPATPMIERNPIVYAQSLSLLRLCHASQEIQADDSQASVPFHATVFNTLEKFKSEAEEVETTTSLLAICDLLGARLVHKPENMKEAFREGCAGSNFIHVHGHADFKLKPQLAQYLKLREPSVDSSDQLSVEEIFELQFIRPSLVLAMGCNTGRAKISPTNDLLGLTAAFHLAGAGTVISTLWRIDRRDCMEFSRAFYADLLERSNNDSPEAVTMDLAQTFRNAVLHLRNDEDGKVRKPYHWAGFTLHGAWLFPRFTFEAPSPASQNNLTVTEAATATSETS